MDAIELLKKYKEKVDEELKIYFDREIKKTGKDNFLAKQAIEIIASFILSGGKRIRPALVYYAYLASGGKEKSDIMRASMSMELIHNFLLIHDDFIDQDAKRHNVPTVHERYRKIGKILARKKDSEHFGNSMAVMCGDMAFAMANEVLYSSEFSPEVIIRALKKLQEIIYVIVPGEMLDVVMEMRGKSDEEEVMKMYEGKTSSYTFEGPLHLGHLLSGKNESQMLRGFSAYAMPIGIAFQIRDDILGLFGDSKKLGKPIGADVSEGKQTLLLVKALEMGDREQKSVIKKYLGKKDLSLEELKEFRKAIINSGSLEYCQKKSEKLAEEALEALSKMNIKNQEARVFLEGIARYIVKREH